MMSKLMRVIKRAASPSQEEARGSENKSSLPSSSLREYGVLSKGLCVEGGRMGVTLQRGDEDE